AGIYQKVDLKDSQVEDFDRIMAVNLRGSYLMTRALIDGMVERGAGVVVFVSSLAGLRGFAGGSIYCASKFAMQGLAESLMLEVRKQGVRVCTVCPGNVRTNMWETEPEPRPLGESIIQPEDVAESIYHACMMPVNAMVSQIQMRSTDMRMPD
ncbi:MAG: SDR family oxidoreductase, partial [bacterium]